MKINVQQVRARDEAKKHEVPPLPKVILRKQFPTTGKEVTTTRSPIAKKIIDATPEEVKQTVKAYGDIQVLVDPLYQEISSIKTQRGILSTRTAYLVTEIANKMFQESPARAADFMDGQIASPELKEHYEKIQALTDQATAVWDKIQYVEQYGKLPGEPEQKPLLQESSVSADALKYEIRRLDDLICKTEAKIKGKAPKNPSRMAQWKTKLSQAEIQRKDKKQQLERLQYDAREQRAGTDQL
jgi:hypothetical protein